VESDDFTTDEILAWGKASRNCNIVLPFVGDEIVHSPLGAIIPGFRELYPDITGPIRRSWCNVNLNRTFMRGVDNIIRSNGAVVVPFEGYLRFD
jgi:hypothetical protein